MSYASYDIKCHIMPNDAYDIEIWHKSIWSILVSKRPSGPQQSHPFFRYWLNNFFKIEKLKRASTKISLYEFWKSFVFLALEICNFWTRPIGQPWIGICNLRISRTIGKLVVIVFVYNCDMEHKFTLKKYCSMWICFRKKSCRSNIWEAHKPKSGYLYSYPHWNRLYICFV